MLDLNALQTAFASIPGYAVNKVLKKNSAIGTVRWAALEVADIPTLTSAKISDFTEAAQDATGAMAANSTKVSLTYVDGTPSLTADIVAGSLGPADIANRTRSIYIPAKLFDIHTATPDYNSHGATLKYWAWAFDSATVEIVTTIFKMPHDYVSGAITIKLHWTNGGAGSGDVRWDVFAQSVADTVSLTANSLTALGNTITAPVTDIQKISTSSGASFTPGATPALVELFIQRNGTLAGDTLANDAWLVGVTVEYTADS